MKIGFFSPAYRGQVHIDHAYTIIRDLFWCAHNDHQLSPFTLASCHLGRVRNWGVREARKQECDLLVMMDSDVYVAAPESALPRMMHLWEKDKPAVVAAVVIGNGNKPNVYRDGTIGTGLMMLDLAQVGRAPLFEPSFSRDGADVACSEDIAFCRLMQARGKRIVITHDVPTVHDRAVKLAIGSEMGVE